MSATNHLLKVNNSYESEPSSGSGSSLGEHNELNSFDEENLNLGIVIKPPSYIAETALNAIVESSPTVIYGPPRAKPSADKSAVSCKVRQLLYDVPVHSSQESPFEGFTESPFGKLQRRMHEHSQPESVKTEIIVHSTGKLKFPKFYDIIIEENSCNAMDVQLQADKESPQRVSASPEELTFNGKIKSLTANEQQPCTSSSMAVAERVHETSLNTSNRGESSFTLKKYSNEKSPDLFGDDDDDDDDEGGDGEDEIDAVQLVLGALKEVDEDDSRPCSTADSNVGNLLGITVHCPTESSFVDEPTADSDTQSLYRENCRRDKELLRRMRKCLAGVPPPPSLTIPQIDLFAAVPNRKEEILNFLTQPSADGHRTTNKSLFAPSHTLQEAQQMPWRDILGVCQHGLSYNLSEASESKEYLGLSVIERFIGAETSTSYRNSPSSAKKRSLRMKLLTQSPGNRLSHLAKRRAIFSSAHLATTSQKTSHSCGPQIALDKKKTKNKRKATPKRMTPGSKKKARKTPTSSARKRLFRFDLIRPGPTRETSKRALFQSPAKQADQKLSQPVKPVTIKPEIATRVEKSKRALFSPDAQAASQPAMSASLFATTTTTETHSLNSLLKRKRPAFANTDDDDALDLGHMRQNSKLFRGSADNLTPRALKIKSQSFCIGAGSSKAATAHTYTATSAQLRALSGSSGRKATSSLGMPRAHSDMGAPSNGLTENQKKKLLWAVSQALLEKKVTVKHESFKEYASVLARVVRRIFQEFYQKNATSNSEIMLRLAKKYAFNVISGKTADDIYFQARAQIDEYKRSSGSRLSGYIGPEEYQQRKRDQLEQPHRLARSQSFASAAPHGGSMQNIFASENSVDSFGMLSGISQSSSLFAGHAQSSGLLASQESQCSSMCASVGKQQLPVQVNSALKNSSSKNNLGGLALRENVDGEQRRSAQKNFTGRDQRNISPYAYAPQRGSAVKVTTTQVKEMVLLPDKAKRQIVFDS